MTGYVYFMHNRDGGPIKIGCTANINRRLGSYGGADHVDYELLATIPGYTCRERMLHMLFRHRRLRREWFKPNFALWAAINEASLYGDLSWLPPEPARFSMKAKDAIERCRAFGMTREEIGRACGNPSPASADWRIGDASAGLMALVLLLEDGMHPSVVLEPTQ